MGTLAIDLIIEILARLPVKSLLRFELVCKPWQNLITSTDFTNLHLQHSHNINNNRFAIVQTNLSRNVYFIDVDNPESLAIKLSAPLFPPYKRFHGMSSCNGLVCFCTHLSPIVRIKLLNPLTGSIFQLQDPPRTFMMAVCFGFGYDHINDDYKVVVLGEFKVIIYSLKAKSWRYIDSDHYPRMSFNLSGVLVNNHLLHWVLYPEKSRKFEITCFDLCSEKWSTILSYKSHFYSGWDYLSIYNGCLCVYRLDWPSLNKAPIPGNVWLLKKYGAEESWVKLNIDRDSSVFNLLYRRHPINHINYPNLWWVEIFTGSLVTVGVDQKIIKKAIRKNITETNRLNPSIASLKRYICR